MAFEKLIEIDGEEYTLTIGLVQKHERKVLITITLIGPNESIIIDQDITPNDLYLQKLQAIFSEKYNEVIKLILEKGRKMKPRLPLAQFPSENINDVTVFIANDPDKASQGLAGVSTGEFSKNSIMFFPKVYDTGSDVNFDNADHCYGPVSFDIEIAFLDEELMILDIIEMAAITGWATPRRGTKIAIEVLPGWFKQNRFQKGIVVPTEWYNPLKGLYHKYRY